MPVINEKNKNKIRNLMVEKIEKIQEKLILKNIENISFENYERF
jgi:hypothetical protein